MKQYKKKPGHVEAIRLVTKNEEAIKALPEHGSALLVMRVPGTGRLRASIRTPHGTTEIEEGSWICRDSEGAIYPCSHKVFKKTYESTD